jgi:hypothetical protein
VGRDRGWRGSPSRVIVPLSAAKKDGGDGGAYG